MADIRWQLSVFVSRWRNRLRYVVAAPRTYRNWWMIVLPKLGCTVVLELRNGLRYLVRPGKTDLAIVNEAAMLNPYLSAGYIQVPEDAVVVDVGANIGDFAMQMAQACPRGRVIGVEPVSEHVRLNAVQKLLNGFENVSCAHVALGDHEGFVEIHADGGHSSAYWGEGASEKVRLTTLACLMQEQGIDRITLLKLDCEGAEWDILPAAEDVLPRIDQICMEFHCAHGWTAEKLAVWLRERGYNVRHTSGSWNGLLWATRDPAKDSGSAISGNRQDRDKDPVAVPAGEQTGHTV
jgi:FkbM family methyltransferase